MAAQLTLQDVSLQFGGIKVLQDVSFAVEPGQIFGLLERNGLGWAAHLPADELSHGLHKGVELCRALLMKPQLLLLDEPAAGLPHAEVETLIATVRRLRAEDDITVVIVEHHMGLIAALTDRVVVLDHGAKLMEGTAAEAQSDARVIEAYIGKDAADDAA
jgi:branched-chain amino acid transport system ATP-binding protein